jgi:hypothetical protein
MPLKRALPRKAGIPLFSGALLCQLGRVLARTDVYRSAMSLIPELSLSAPGSATDPCREARPKSKMPNPTQPDQLKSPFLQHKPTLQPDVWRRLAIVQPPCQPAQHASVTIKACMLVAWTSNPPSLHLALPHSSLALPLSKAGPLPLSPSHSLSLSLRARAADAAASAETIFNSNEVMYTCCGPFRDGRMEW